MKQNANNPISKNILMALENAHLIYNQVSGGFKTVKYHMLRILGK